MTEFIDYYAILKVQRNASIHEVNAAFMKRFWELRPDINLDDVAKKEFERLEEAQRVLSSPVDRILYSSAYDTQVLSIIAEGIRAMVEADVNTAKKLVEDYKKQPT